MLGTAVYQLHQHQLTSSPEKVSRIIWHLQRTQWLRGLQCAALTIKQICRNPGCLTFSFSPETQTNRQVLVLHSEKAAQQIGYCYTAICHVLAHSPSKGSAMTQKYSNKQPFYWIVYSSPLLQVIRVSFAHTCQWKSWWQMLWQSKTSCGCQLSSHVTCLICYRILEIQLKNYLTWCLRSHYLLKIFMRSFLDSLTTIHNYPCQHIFIKQLKCIFL